jgi:hypothetical protein
VNESYFYYPSAKCVSFPFLEKPTQPYGDPLEFSVIDGNTQRIQILAMKWRKKKKSSLLYSFHL